MRLSSGTLYHSVVLVVRCTLVTSLPRTGQLYRPVEYVDFSLLPATSPGGSSDLAAVRYDLMSAGGGREREGALPLLSRGVRDITNDEEEEEEDSVRVPSCSELRRCGVVLIGCEVFGQVVGSIRNMVLCSKCYFIPQDVENREADPPACDPHE